MMQDPEVKKALLGKSDDAELESLLEDMDIGEDDTIESVAKKSSAKMKKLVKYFTTQMAKVGKDAVEEATKDTREKEAATINEFATKNPGMKNPEVVALMQPLYDKGKPMAECYKVACKALDLDPVTGEAPKEETTEEKTAREAKEAKAKKAKEKETKGAKQSAKSGAAAEEEDLDEGDPDKDTKDDKPVSIDDALAAASAEYTAKHGNPYDQKE